MKQRIGMLLEGHKGLGQNVKNIVLTGFMGVGKTTVGEQLAKRLGVEFFDTDEIIERQEGKTVSQILDTEGEEYFRRLEDKALRELLDQGPAVISTGGGTFENPELRRLCKEKAVSVWLVSSFERLLGGMEELRKSRPMLKLQTLEEVKELYEKRSVHYAESDFAVETKDMSQEQVVDAILELLKKRSYGIEEAARQYFEITLYGEPVTSPEAIFEELTGRKATAQESKLIWDRINELLKPRKE